MYLILHPDRLDGMKGDCVQHNHRGNQCIGDGVVGNIDAGNRFNFLQ